MEVSIGDSEEAREDQGSEGVHSEAEESIRRSLGLGNSIGRTCLYMRSSSFFGREKNFYPCALTGTNLEIGSNQPAARSGSYRNNSLISL